jgi:predicted PurR-regulated permease PerM
VVVCGTVLVGLGTAYWYRAVFGPLLLALALAYMYEPLVQRLCARGLGRRLSVTLVFLGTSAVALTVLLLLGWQASDLIGGNEGALRESLDRLAENLNALVGGELGQKLAMRAKGLFDSDLWKSVLSYLGTLGTSLSEGVWSALNLLSILFLLPVYIFYLMLAMPTLWSWCVEHLPRRDRGRTLRVLQSMHEGLDAFLRGRVVVGFLKGAVTSIGLTLCSTPSAVAIGLLNGLLSIVPYVGTILAGALAALASIASGQPLSALAWVALVFAIAEGLEGFVLTPWILGHSLALHPLTMLFSVVFWAYALGLFGALVAIPLTLVLKILLREYVLPSVEKLAR